MLQKIKPSDTLKSDTVSTSPCAGTNPPKGSIIVPLCTQIEQQEITKSIDAQYKELIDIAKEKLPGIKTNFLTNFLDMNKDTKAELIRLVDDKKINGRIIDYITANNVTDLKEMLHDKEHQNKLISMVTDYAKNEGYPNTAKFLERKIIQKALKSYLSEI